MPARVLLVYPNVWADVFPLSILLLSAVLKEAGHDVEVFTATDPQRLAGSTEPDEVLQTRMRAFESVISDFDPQLIAFSVVEDAFPLAVSLLDCIPENHPKVIVGGVFATFAPHLVLKHPRVDAVCIGEGEAALRDLANRVLTKGNTFSGIRGLKTREVTNPPATLIDLNTLPPPDYSILVDAEFSGPSP